MRFEIPFTYDAHFVKKRHSRSESVRRFATGFIEIEEVSAPVLLRAGHDRSDQRTVRAMQRFSMQSDGQPARVWKHEGLLFSELCGVDEFQKRMVERDWVFDAWEGGVSAEPLDHIETAEEAREQDMTHERVVAAHGDLRSWQDDGGDRRLQAIRRRTQDLRIIDGRVAVVVGEPLYVIAPDVIDDTRQVSIVVEESDRTTLSGMTVMQETILGSSGRRFPLNRKAEALAYAQALSALEGVSVVDHSHVDVPIDYVSDHPWESEAVAGAGQAVADNMGTVIAQYPREIAMAVRHVIDASKAAPREDATFELAATLRDLVSVGEADLSHWRGAGSQWRRAWNAMATSDQGWARKVDPEVALDHCLFLVREALRDWESRPTADDRTWTGMAFPLAHVVTEAPAERTFRRPDRIEQVLSTRSLNRLAHDLGAEKALLQEAIRRGDPVFRAEVNDTAFAVVTSPNLVVQDVFGARGRRISLPAVAEDWLDAMRRARDEEMMLDLPALA